MAFLIDLSGDNYLEAFDILLNELKTYSGELAKKKRLIAGTKTDLEETSGRLAELAEKYPEEEVMGISVFSGEGIKELSLAFLRLTENASEDSAENLPEDEFSHNGGLAEDEFSDSESIEGEFL